MRIRVFDSVSHHNGKPDDLDIDRPHKLVRITHGELTYELHEDSKGRLTMRQVDGRQISVAPLASNLIEIRTDTWTQAHKRPEGT